MEGTVGIADESSIHTILVIAPCRSFVVVVAVWVISSSILARIIQEEKCQLRKYFHPDGLYESLWYVLLINDCCVWREQSIFSVATPWVGGPELCKRAGWTNP